MSNPLEEASPLSLDALFSADPKSLTDSEIETIVTELRRGRARMIAAEQAGKSTRSVATKAPKIAPPKNFNIADLDL